MEENVRSIKLWDGVRVTTTKWSEVTASPIELWKCLNMNGSEYDELKTEVMKQLMCFGKCDLSPQYGGNMVMLTVVNEED